MKNLTISLLIVSLTLIFFSSCDNAKSADIASNDTPSKVEFKGEINPPEKLSKEEVLERMHKAHQDKSIMNEETSDMVAKKKTQGGRIGADQAEQSSRNAKEKFEKVKDTPPTRRQKNVASNICKCLNRNPLFSTLSKTKTSKEILKIAGEDKDKEVKSLQDCYNSLMVPAVNDLGEEAGIFAMKSRKYLNKQCLDGTDKFWINIGEHLNRHARKIQDNTDKLENAESLLRKKTGK